MEGSSVDTVAYRTRAVLSWRTQVPDIVIVCPLGPLGVVCSGSRTLLWKEIAKPGDVKPLTSASGFSDSSVIL